MRENSQEYILENKTIAELTITDLLEHSSEIIDSDGKYFFDIQPAEIKLNSGLFSHPSTFLGFPPVQVNQVEQGISIFCSCRAVKKKLCNHQTQVLLNIMKHPYLRIFFDEKFRLGKLQLAAKDFGMENEADLENYFVVEYTNLSFEIKPRINGLIKINPKTKSQLEEQLLYKKLSKPFKSVDKAVNKKIILVLQKSKYYGLLNIELYEGETSKDGKIKNPFVTIDPLNLLWKTEHITVAKFLTGVSKFQKNYSFTDNQTNSEEDLKWLKQIAENPLNLDIYSHNRHISEKINANSIKQIELKVLDIDIRLSVFKKEPFYEVSGEIVIDSKAYPFKDLNINYNYFIHTGNTLNLMADPGMLRVVKFFKANNEKVIIHSSKYDEFRENILSKLEAQITINYSFIKPATKKQLVEQLFDRKTEKLIYLSENENFIYITPVMQYGNIEIPVFSKKQIYDTDQNGNVFKVERDKEEENRFSAVILRQHPEFEEQVNTAESFYLYREKFLEETWFLNTFAEWKNYGITILGFNDLKKNKLNQNKASVSIKVSSGIEWFNAEVTIIYGKQKATLKQLHKSVRNKSRFVQLDDGTMGILPEEWLKKLEGYFQSGEVTGEINNELIRIPKSNFGEINSLFDNINLDNSIINELNSFHKKFANFKAIPAVKVPSGLKAKLRHYQLQGLSWLNLLDDLNFGSCLADDMGLGKTIQIIAFILLQRTKQARNTNLVIVPTSLLFNWQQEVEKFAPSIKLYTHYGPGRKRDNKGFDQYEIILTTYGMLLSDINFLKNYFFNYIFLDESQAVKNPESQRYKSARLLRSRNKVVLTGTPIENNTFDLYGQLSFACPGLLGHKQYFKEIYSVPIDKFADETRSVELQEKIKPFILRRTKKEVAKELPDKTEMVIYCEMGEDQRRIYNLFEKELREFVTSKNETEITKNSMHVLTGITKLRQICNSPSLVKNEKHLGDFSAKIETLIEQIENKSPHHKILVFSQFVGMLDLIKKDLDKKTIQYEYLTGQTRDREARIKRFRENSETRIFLISLKAGGIGLNLTEADYVYLVDPWWNPAVENQAIDRCYRIGQKKNVIAVRLICPDTIEEKIMRLQKSKTNLANDLIKTDNSIFKSLSKNDLIALLE